MNAVIINGVNITEKYEELKKDVARYFDMLENHEGYTNEFRALYDKLSKVGKEE